MLLAAANATHVTPYLAFRTLATNNTLSSPTCHSWAVSASCFPARSGAQTRKRTLLGQSQLLAVFGEDDRSEVSHGQGVPSRNPYKRVIRPTQQGKWSAVSRVPRKLGCAKWWVGQS